MQIPPMTFDVMRENCIEIYEVVYKIDRLSQHLGKSLTFPVPFEHIKTAEQLAKHPITKSWFGMAHFAKVLYDDTKFWDQIPNTSFTVICRDMDNPYQSRFEWSTNEQKQNLLKSYLSLGGDRAYEYSKYELDQK